MEATLTSVKENPLMDRIEAEVTLDHDGEPTPSEEDIRSRVAAENNLDEENIQIDSVETGFGSTTSHARLKITEEFEYDEELEQDSTEETRETASTGGDYEDIVSGTITEAKDALQEMEDPDWNKALEAEKNSKNRTTFIDWLETQQS